MSAGVGTADIEVDGKTYIIEWFKSEGMIQITETCDDPDDEDGEHDHETYDFKEDE